MLEDYIKKLDELKGDISPENYDKVLDLIQYGIRGGQILSNNFSQSRTDVKRFLKYVKKEIRDLKI